MRLILQRRLKNTKRREAVFTEDREIIDLFFERDERAIAEASDKYGGMCRTVAYGILGSEGDAEECLSDAMLKAWQNIPPERPAFPYSRALSTK